MSQKKFRLRQKPTEPKREIVSRKVQICEGYSIKELLDSLPDNVDFADITIMLSSDYWDNYEYIYACWKEPEDERTFNAKLSYYEKRLEAYNKWYEENKEKIEEELKRRTDKKEKQRERKIERLMKEAERLKKEAEKLKG